MKRTKRVALLFPATRTCEAQLVRGVTDYASEHARWTLDGNPEIFDISVRTLAGWAGDGMLAFLRTETQLRAAQSLGVPVVNLSGSLCHSAVPRVMIDHETAGRLAAEHFLDRGFRRGAYFGLQDVWYSAQRCRGFVERIRQAGGECSVLETSSGVGARHPWYHWMKLLERWLRKLKTPVGLMAAHDYRARVALDACLRLGLRVPQDVALMGVDNDEIACEFSPVPLSSVARDSWREGFEAAALLDRLMQAKQPPKGDVLIPPKGVVARLSTSVDAIENPYVAAAVRLIRERLAESFGVEMLEKHMDISRRYLYRLFDRFLGCTPSHYINRARVARAQELLARPDKLSLHHIAQACGFSETRRLRVVFQRITGMTLAEYRRSLFVR
jgi:LacI family transcriptional regulator